VANTAPTSSDDVILIDSESGNLRIVGAQTNIDRVVPKPLPKKKRTLRDIQSEDEEALQYESMVPRHRASRWAGVERTLFDSYSEKSSTGESARNEDVGVGGPIRLSKEESDASPRMVNRTIEKRRRLLESDDEEELWAGME
jgi:hypothetical protein